jgi:hypothetical protein
MIVVMKKGASMEQINHMIERVEQLGLKTHPIFGTERTVIAAVGEKRDECRQSLESGPGVAEVVPILAPYKVASREVKPEPTVVRAGTLAVGNSHVRDGRAVCRGMRRADDCHGPGGEGRRGHCAARRGVQTSHQPVESF